MGNSLGTSNVAGAEQHYVSAGQAEGRDCTCPTPAPPGGCNWQCYLDRYPDLSSIFGMSNTAVAESHYLSAGQAEGRDCTCPTPATPGTPAPQGACNWQCY